MELRISGRGKLKLVVGEVRISGMGKLELVEGEVRNSGRGGVRISGRGKAYLSSLPTEVLLYL